MVTSVAGPGGGGAELTARQRNILRFVGEAIRQRGYSPSLREIAQATGLASTSSVARQLSILQRRGYLERAPRRPRTAVIRLPGGPGASAGPAAGQQRSPGDEQRVAGDEQRRSGDATIPGPEPEATVKTFKRVGGHVWLMPHNPAYDPILGDEATIAGKVVAVLRRL